MTQYTLEMESVAAVEVAYEVLRDMDSHFFPLSNGRNAEMGICEPFVEVIVNHWEDINPTLTALSEMGFSGTVEIYRVNMENCFVDEDFMDLRRI